MISVICPVYNESAYISRVLEFFERALPVEKELILIDGNSTDNTCAIIELYQQNKPDLNIRLLHNPSRYVPFALNLAIPEAKGNVIVRLDAHTDYSPDYFECIIETFKKTGADIVGGPMRIAKGNAVQAAIGYATSTRFGVGNSSFHFENFEGYTESVYLGAWKKEIFEKTGLFDTAFHRNQDDEFHYRAKSLGYRVYQDPSIKLFYHPRKTIGKLYAQYYQYGLYKPLVLKKIKSAVNIRHIIPSFFVLYLLMLPFMLLAGFFVAFIPLGIYLSSALALAIASKRKWEEILLIPIVYITIHIAYGAGFIAGMLKDPSAKHTTSTKQLSYPFK